MELHAYSSEGIILARRNFGEADRILSVFSKDMGRIFLIAKGIRRPASKKRGHVEIFTHLKYQAVSGKSLPIMTEAEVISDFKKVRKSLNKISLAYYFMEVTGKITHEGESNKKLFDLLLSNLKELENTRLLKDLKKEFILKLLVLLGYWPEGKKMEDSDRALEEVVERQISSKRVGKRMLEV
jgi:DNA repair protein RecO (recombination protein O)